VNGEAEFKPFFIKNKMHNIQEISISGSTINFYMKELKMKKIINSVSTTSMAWAITQFLDGHRRFAATEHLAQL